MSVDIPDFGIEYLADDGDTPIVDKFNSAIKMAFVGVGQGGGRIVQSFSDIGYGRCCVINTTEQDLAALTVPNKLVIGKKGGGAGKDPEQGRIAARESMEDIMDLLNKSWGSDAEHLWVCVGAGGGSGTGSWPIVLSCVDQWARTNSSSKKSLGIIITIPKYSEGARVQKNAIEALEAAIDVVDRGEVQSLIILDNAKIHSLYPKLPVKKFWGVVNQNFANTFHVFNILASENSEYNTFDKADYKSTLNNGIMIFGTTKVSEWNHKEDIAKAIRSNLTNTLLADGFDLSKADMAASVVVAHDDVLQEIPMENIDYAFQSLGRILGNSGITLHSGIYESTNQGMTVFTIISGLEPPYQRLKEIEAGSI